ncbi:TrbI/VirB10 family protein [Sphingomonas colocasiae]|uniref:Conjugal transfer protein TrbI n=1 Tax=Sphingomonas colocasiae TaxID=1848973 RepID=A0ABS7PPN9_9SPHN|nr:TrbI/VirB10 family protein [Sphingomonas colocasiae]MBY8823188.1 conjugal transfer protein TrbI [Sphingomonas colocasiae]
MADESATPTVVPQKVDPETLAIRARPPRAIRFRRGAIIGAAAIGSGGLMAVAWLALQPRVFRQVAQESELSQPNSRAAGDALNDLPSSYGDVPKLGPPLPGDLGRPILRAQEREQVAVAGAGPDAAESARTERERRASELRAARESGLLIQASGRAGSASPQSVADVNMGMPQAPSASAGDRKAAFVSTPDSKGDLNPHRTTSPPSPHMLMAGSVITASLITGLNSDLPGLVTAQVSENAYDSATGRILLVPQGARLIGRYDHVVAFGQSRALVIWDRLIMPDGRSVRLDNMSATDAAGYAGIADKVDFHSWRLLKGIALATLLGVGTELSLTGESDLVEALRESAQSNTARAGDRLAQRNLDIQPTITIRPGTPVRLLVNRDLVLEPWRERGL